MPKIDLRLFGNQLVRGWTENQVSKRDDPYMFFLSVQQEERNGAIRSRIRQKVGKSSISGGSALENSFSLPKLQM